MTNGKTRTTLIKGNEMDMEYVMDDDPHSPTDSSEDSVEVKVEVISNRQKRKLAEPRRISSGPLKKRLCVRSDHSAQPFRPWNEKETESNNNKEEEVNKQSDERFYEKSEERIKSSDESDAIKSTYFHPRLVLKEEVAAFQPSTAENGGEVRFPNPAVSSRSIEDDESRGGFFQPPVIPRDAELKPQIQPSVRVLVSSEDDESRGSYFQPPSIATRGLTGETPLYFKQVLEHNGGYFQPPAVTLNIENECCNIKEESKGSYFQPPVVPKGLLEDGNYFQHATISNGSTQDEETKAELFLTKSSSYFQPQVLSEKWRSHTNIEGEEEKNFACVATPLDLVKTQAARVKDEPQSPRIPTHPKPEDSIESAEEMISGTMLSFPKLNQKKYKNANASQNYNEDTNVEIKSKNLSGVELRNYKNLPSVSAAEQNQQRNYKNMTRERRIEANARERTRVHTISAAFETLRKSVPAYSDKQKLSKLSVLRIACNYIQTLEHLLRDDVDEELLQESVEKVGGTIQREGKLRKKKDED